MIADVPALIAALNGIKLLVNMPPGKVSYLPQSKCGSWPPFPAPPPGKCLVVSATEEESSRFPWKPNITSVIICATHSAFSPKVPSILCQRGSVERSAIYMYPLRKPTDFHSCLAMSAKSLTNFKSCIADNPSSPGQVEKTVLPTLKPTEASFVIWLRGFDAMIAGIPKPSLSQSACNLFAHSAVTLALAFARRIK